MMILILGSKLLNSSRRNTREVWLDAWKLFPRFHQDKPELIKKEMKPPRDE